MPPTEPLTTAQRLDAAVAANRAARLTGPVNEAAKARRGARASIAELNQQDLDSIRERIAVTAEANKGPVEMAVDLIDLPRNLVGNILAPSLAEKARKSHETGAFGLGRVSVSDVLVEMGVENRLVRGIAGFVGDTLFDPLTYAGPAGWGFRAGGTAIRGAGKKALRGAVEEAATGAARGTVDDIARNVVSSAFKPGELEALRASGKSAKEIRSIIDTAVRGDTTDRLLGKTLSAVGGERSYSGGVLGRALEARVVGKDADVLKQIEAARAFAGKYGRGTGGGIKIGRGGSEVAHIPFTDKTLQVPSFTALAGESIRNAAIAKDATMAAQELAGPASARAKVLLNAQRAALGNALAGDSKAIEEASALGDELEGAIATFTNEAVNKNLSPNDLLALREQADEIGLIRQRLATQRHQLEVGKRLGATKRTEAELADLPKYAQDAIANVRAVEGTVDDQKAALEWADDAEDIADDMGRPTANPLKGVMKSYEQGIGAALNLANNYRTGIVPYLNAPEKAMVEAAKYAFGVSNDRAGASLIAGMRAALSGNKSPGAQAIGADILDAMDRGIARAGLLGGSGDMDDAIRARRHLDAKMGPANQRLVRSMDQDVTRIMAKNGVPEEQREAVGQLLLLKWEASRQAINPERIALKYRSVAPGQYGKVLDAEGNARLADAAKGALLQRGTLSDDLDQIVSQYRTLNNELAETALRGGNLDTLLDQHVPRTLSDKTRQIVTNQKSAQAGGAVPTQTSSDVADFNIPRTTTLYDWADDENPERWFYEWQRHMQAMSDADVQAIPNAAERQFVTDRRAAMAEYDDMLRAGEAPQGKYLDTFTANKLAGEGAFDYLNRSARGDDFFSTNPVEIWANRLHSHERAMADNQLARSIMASGYEVPHDTMNNLIRSPIGKVFKYKGAEFERLPGDSLRIRVGGPGGQVLTRASDVATGHLQNPLAAMYAQQAGNVLIPEEQARRVNDVLKVEPNSVLKEVAAFSNVWRTLTLGHPSWIVNNLYGSMTQWLAQNLPAPDLAKARAYNAIIAARNDPAKLAALPNVLIGDRTLTAQQASDLFNEFARVGDTMGNYELSFLTRYNHLRMPSNDGYKPDSFAEFWGSRPRRAVRGLKFIPSDYRHARDTHRALGATKAGAAVKGAGAVLTDRLASSLYQPFFRANTRMEALIRALGFDAAVREGNDFQSAGRRVAETFFDYSDLSRNESAHIKTLFPFYAWLKNNSALQLKTLFRRPAVAAAFPKVRDAVEDMLNGEEQVPMHMRPRWMRNELAIQVGTDPETRQAFMAAQSLPQADVYRWLGAAIGPEGLQDFIHWFGSQVTPVLTAPLQYGAGREFFSDRSIGDPDTADIGRLEFLAKQARPLAELGFGSRSDGPLSRAAEQGIGPAIGRLLLGGKAQDLSDERIERQNLRDYTDRVGALRRNIARSERAGNTEESLRLRVRLLETYRAMQEAGLGAEVPRWAAKNLQEVGA